MKQPFRVPTRRTVCAIDLTSAGDVYELSTIRPSRNRQFIGGRRRPGRRGSVGRGRLRRGSSSMSEVADGPDTNVTGRRSSPFAARSASASGRSSTIWLPHDADVEVGDQRDRAPALARPAVSTMVPVSAIATEQPVTTPSKPSSSRVDSSRSSTSSSSALRQAGGRPAGRRAAGVVRAADRGDLRRDSGGVDAVYVRAVFVDAAAEERDAFPGGKRSGTAVGAWRRSAGPSFDVTDACEDLGRVPRSSAVTTRSRKLSRGIRFRSRVRVQAPSGRHGGAPAAVRAGRAAERLRSGEGRRTPTRRRASARAPWRNPSPRRPSPAGGAAPSGCRSSPGRPRSRRRRGSTRRAAWARSRSRSAAASGSRRSARGRPSRTHARRCVSRRGRRSGRRCSGCSAAPGGRLRRASTRVRPLSSRTTWNSCGPSPGVTPGPERRVRVHPLAGRGARQQLQEDLEVGEAGSSFSIPSIVTSTVGRVVHIRPLPSDSTTQTVPVSAIAEVRAADADARGRGTARAGRRARPRRGRAGRRTRSRARSSARRGRGSRCGCGGSPGRGCATTSRRRAGGSARRSRSRARGFPRRRAPR